MRHGCAAPRVQDVRAAHRVEHGVLRAVEHVPNLVGAQDQHAATPIIGSASFHRWETSPKCVVTQSSS